MVERRIKGQVYYSSGKQCKVRAEDGEVFSCMIRGKFRIQDIQSTNPVAVGDWVLIIPPDSGSELAMVAEVLPRSNMIARKAVTQSKKVHILCANVDLALLIFTIAQPRTSYGFADRFLTVTQAHDIPTKIVINKIDLLDTDESKEILQETVNIYENLGYEVLLLSAKDARYRGQVQDLLQGKLTFIGGHSGSGKSTLINLVDPQFELPTTEVSDFNQKGRHTTTRTEMFPLSVGGYIIDSPGIKELGLSNFDATEIRNYFPELEKLADECKFRNCMHVQEPGCAVRSALDAGHIALPRYKSYLSILADIEENKTLYI